jgi:L-lactate dehydrogenase complex protein LldG
MTEALNNRVLADIRSALKRTESLRPVPLSLFDEPDVVQGDATERFIQEAIALGSDVHRISNGSDVATTIAEICKPNNEIVLTRSSMIEELDLGPRLQSLGLSVTFISEFPRDEVIPRLAVVNVGVTGVHCAIAETGTILLTSEDHHSLLASLLPPIHIAVLRSSQIKRSLHEVIEELGSEMLANTARSATFITSTSRTGDVELTLSIGVHGPKELHLIVVDSMP